MSLSPSSRDSQAVGRPLAATHSAASVVLPKPAGAEIRVSLDCEPSFKRSIKRGRSTTFDPSEGTKSFVARIGIRRLYHGNQIDAFDGPRVRIAAISTAGGFGLDAGRGLPRYGRCPEVDDASAHARTKLDAACSTPSRVVSLPSDTRTAPQAASGPRPMARRTPDGLSVPSWHADPVDPSPTVLPRGRGRSGLVRGYFQVTE
jgi:hypothetical protein